MRFPRRQEGADLTDRELLVLPRLAPLLPLLVPAPEHVGPLDDGEDRTDGYPWRFTGGARGARGRVVARPARARRTRSPRRERLGAALGVLHSPEVGDHLADAVARLPVDPNRRTEPSERLRRSGPAHARLAAAGLLGPGLATAALEALAGTAGSAPRAPAVLVHGDLHVRHVLVAAGVPTGLVDWGDVCRAEASVDLMAAFALLDGEPRQALLDRYGPVAAGVLERARLLAATLHLQLADSALDTGDEPLLAAALAAAHRSGPGLEPRGAQVSGRTQARARLRGHDHAA